MILSLWFQCLSFQSGIIKLWVYFQGYEILIETKGQSSLPETLKKVAVVKFKVTDVDDAEKREIL